ncbi:hypothetical protein [Lysobacter sp. Root96]|uniref:hypothetical protein n=1 Tax=Lysobacter sp. Root96 TaxID=1736612 RepID=UPI0006F72C60|nr:hypothetical protein [Lysobacter sp. Root96]KRD71460.1 hypothetical protein ASE45_06525 [Lysobacter sp. Root96]
MTASTREQVMAQALVLQAMLPSMVKRYPDDAHFWPAFAAAADPIMEAAGKVDDDMHEDVFLMIESMLWRAGKVDPDHVLQT